MYHKDEFHVIFIGLFRDLTKSPIIIQEFGEDLIECAKQLISQLDNKSPYTKLYQDYCNSLNK